MTFTPLLRRPKVPYRPKFLTVVEIVSRGSQLRHFDSLAGLWRTMHYVNTGLSPNDEVDGQSRLEFPLLSVAKLLAGFFRNTP